MEMTWHQFFTLQMLYLNLVLILPMVRAIRNSDSYARRVFVIIWLVVILGSMFLCRIA